MNTEPKCLDCGVDLDWLDNIDFDFEHKVYITVVGTCPKCGKDYQWIERYAFEKFFDLTEIPS